jgi:hypothetical protein
MSTLNQTNTVLMSKAIQYTTLRLIAYLVEGSHNEFGAEKREGERIHILGSQGRSVQKNVPPVGLRLRHPLIRIFGPRNARLNGENKQPFRRLILFLLLLLQLAFQVGCRNSQVGPPERSAHDSSAFFFRGRHHPAHRIALVIINGEQSVVCVKWVRLREKLVRRSTRSCKNHTVVSFAQIHVFHNSPPHVRLHGAFLCCSI